MAEGVVGAATAKEVEAKEAVVKEAVAMEETLAVATEGEKATGHPRHLMSPSSRT